MLTIFITVSFLLPYLTWAFDQGNYARALGPQALVVQGKSLAIPEKLGTVQQTFGGGEKTLVVVQDLHCNYEIQKNIAALIQYLAQEHGLKLIGEEGAFAAVPTARLRAFPVAGVRDEVGEYFLKLGKLTGAEYSAVTGPAPVRVEGIETPALYTASRNLVGAFLNDESLGYCQDLREALGRVRLKAYNPPLRKLDAQRQLYRKGELDLLAYAVFLLKTGQQQSLDLGAYPALLAFCRLGQNQFTPAVDQDRLYVELEQLDRAVRRGWYTTPLQEKADAFDARLDVVEKLLNISASPEEVARFRQAPGAFGVRVFTDFLEQNRGEDQEPLDAEIASLDQRLGQVAEFYALADRRSQVFVERMLAQMDGGRENLGLMITGGFHSDAVLAELKRRHVAYVCVKPRLEHQDVVNPYFSLLQNRRTPLEKLLEKNQTILALRSCLEQPVYFNEVLLLLGLLGAGSLAPESLRAFLAGTPVAVGLLPAAGLTTEQNRLLAGLQRSGIARAYSTWLKNPQGGQVTALVAPAGTMPENLAALDTVKLAQHVVSLFPDAAALGEAARALAAAQQAAQSPWARAWTAFKHLGQGIVAAAPAVLRGDFGRLYVHTASPGGRGIIAYLLAPLFEGVRLIAPAAFFLILGLAVPATGVAALLLPWAGVLAALIWVGFYADRLAFKYHAWVVDPHTGNLRPGTPFEQGFWFLSFLFLGVLSVAFMVSAAPGRTLPLNFFTAAFWLGTVAGLATAAHAGLSWVMVHVFQKAPGMGSREMSAAETRDRAEFAEIVDAIADADKQTRVRYAISPTQITVTIFNLSLVNLKRTFTTLTEGTLRLVREYSFALNAARGADPALLNNGPKVAALGRAILADPAPVGPARLVLKELAAKYRPLARERNVIADFVNLNGATLANQVGVSKDFIALWDQFRTAPDFQKIRLNNRLTSNEALAVFEGFVQAQMAAMGVGEKTNPPATGIPPKPGQGRLKAPGPRDGAYQAELERLKALQPRFLEIAARTRNNAVMVLGFQGQQYSYPTAYEAPVIIHDDSLGAAAGYHFVIENGPDRGRRVIVINSLKTPTIQRQAAEHELAELFLIVKSLKAGVFTSEAEAEEAAHRVVSVSLQQAFSKTGELMDYYTDALRDMDPANLGKLIAEYQAGREPVLEKIESAVRIFRQAGLNVTLDLGQAQKHEERLFQYAQLVRSAKLALQAMEAQAPANDPGHRLYLFQQYLEAAQNQLGAKRLNPGALPAKAFKAFVDALKFEGAGESGALVRSLNQIATLLLTPEIDAYRAGTAERIVRVLEEEGADSQARLELYTKYFDLAGAVLRTLGREAEGTPRAAFLADPVGEALADTLRVQPQGEALQAGVLRKLLAAVATPELFQEKISPLQALRLTTLVQAAEAQRVMAAPAVKDKIAEYQAALQKTAREAANRENARLAALRKSPAEEGRDILDALIAKYSAPGVALPKLSYSQFSETFFYGKRGAYDAVKDEADALHQALAKSADNAEFSDRALQIQNAIATLQAPLVKSSPGSASAFLAEAEPLIEAEFLLAFRYNLNMPLDIGSKFWVKFLGKYLAGPADMVVVLGAAIDGQLGKAKLSTPTQAFSQQDQFQAALHAALAETPQILSLTPLQRAGAPIIAFLKLARMRQSINMLKIESTWRDMVSKNAWAFNHIDAYNAVEDLRAEAVRSASLDEFFNSEKVKAILRQLETPGQALTTDATREWVASWAKRLPGWAQALTAELLVAFWYEATPENILRPGKFIFEKHDASAPWQSALRIFGVTAMYAGAVWAVSLLTGLSLVAAGLGLAAGWRSWYLAVRNQLGNQGWKPKLAGFALGYMMLLLGLVVAIAVSGAVVPLTVWLLSPALGLTGYALGHEAYNLANRLLSLPFSFVISAFRRQWTDLSASLTTEGAGDALAPLAAQLKALAKAHGPLRLWISQQPGAQVKVEIIAAGRNTSLGLLTPDQRSVWSDSVLVRGLPAQGAAVINISATAAIPQIRAQLAADLAFPLTAVQQSLPPVITQLGLLADVSFWRRFRQNQQVLAAHTRQPGEAATAGTMLEFAEPAWAPYISETTDLVAFSLAQLNLSPRRGDKLVFAYPEAAHVHEGYFKRTGRRQGTVAILPEILTDPHQAPLLAAILVAEVGHAADYFQKNTVGIFPMELEEAGLLESRVDFKLTEALEHIRFDRLGVDVLQSKADDLLAAQIARQALGTARVHEQEEHRAADLPAVVTLALVKMPDKIQDRLLINQLLDLSMAWLNLASARSYRVTPAVAPAVADLNRAIADLVSLGTSIKSEADWQAQREALLAAVTVYLTSVARAWEGMALSRPVLGLKTEQQAQMARGAIKLVFVDFVRVNRDVFQASSFEQFRQTHLYRALNNQPVDTEEFKLAYQYLHSPSLSLLLADTLLDAEFHALGGPRSMLASLITIIDDLEASAGTPDPARGPLLSALRRQAQDAFNALSRIPAVVAADPMPDEIPPAPAAVSSLSLSAARLGLKLRAWITRGEFQESQVLPVAATQVAPVLELLQMLAAGGLWAFLIAAVPALIQGQAGALPQLLAAVARLHLTVTQTLVAPVLAYGSWVVSHWQAVYQKANGPPAVLETISLQGWTGPNGRLTNWLKIAQAGLGIYLPLFVVLGATVLATASVSSVSFLVLLLVFNAVTFGWAVYGHWGRNAASLGQAIRFWPAVPAKIQSALRRYFTSARVLLLPGNSGDLVPAEEWHALSLSLIESLMRFSPQGAQTPVAGLHSGLWFSPKDRAPYAWHPVATLGQLYEYLSNNPGAVLVGVVAAPMAYDEEPGQGPALPKLVIAQAGDRGAESLTYRELAQRFLQCQQASVATLERRQPIFAALLNGPTLWGLRQGLDLASVKTELAAGTARTPFQKVYDWEGIILTEAGSADLTDPSLTGHWRERFRALAAENPGKRLKVLDAGAGMLPVLRIAREVFAGLGQAAELHGVDSAKLPADKIPAGVRYHELALEDMPVDAGNPDFAPGSFDAFTSMFALEYGRLELILTKLNRLLKMNGTGTILAHYPQSDLARSAANHLALVRNLASENVFPKARALLNAAPGSPAFIQARDALRSSYYELGHGVLHQVAAGSDLGLGLQHFLIRFLGSQNAVQRRVLLEEAEELYQLDIEKSQALLEAAGTFGLDHDQLVEFFRHYGFAAEVRLYHSQAEGEPAGTVLAWDIRVRKVAELAGETAVAPSPGVLARWQGAARAFGEKQIEVFRRLYEEIVAPRLGRQTRQAAYFGSAGNGGSLLLATNFDQAILMDERPFRYQPWSDPKPEAEAKAFYFQRTRERNYLITEDLMAFAPSWFQLKWELEALGVPADQITVNQPVPGIWRIAFPFAYPGEASKPRTVWYVEQVAELQDLAWGQLQALGVDAGATNLIFDKGADQVKGAPLLMAAKVSPGSLVISDQLAVALGLSYLPGRRLPLSATLAALSPHFGRMGDATPALNLKVMSEIVVFEVGAQPGTGNLKFGEQRNFLLRFGALLPVLAGLFAAFSGQDIVRLTETGLAILFGFTGRAALAGICEWLIKGRTLGPREPGLVYYDAEAGRVALNLATPFHGPAVLRAVLGWVLAAPLIALSLVHEFLHQVQPVWGENFILGVESLLLFSGVLLLPGAWVLPVLAAMVVLSAAMTWWRGVSQHRAERLARTQPAQALTSLGEVLGPEGVAVNEPLESSLNRHALGRVIARNRNGIFGAKFNLLENIRFRSGRWFGAGYEEMAPGANDLNKDFNEASVAFVITLPAVLSRVLQRAPQPAAGRVASWLYAAESRAAALVLNYQLRHYAAETASFKPDENLEPGLDEYQGRDLLKLRLPGLRGLGGRVSGEEFYRPQGGRQVGVTAPEIMKLLLALRSAGNLDSQSLWQTLGAPLSSLLQEDGAAPSAATLCRAVELMRLEDLADPAQRQVWSVLQNSVRSARTGQADNPALSGVLVNALGEMVVRSRDGIRLDAMALREAAAVPGQPAVFDQMQLVLSPAEKENLRALVAATRQSLAPASPLQGPLQILQDLLAPGTAALSPQASLQLQHLLRAAALPAGSVHSVYVGEEASPQCAGSMVNGLLEDLPKVSVQGFKLEMAKPVVANVFHASREVIENLGRVGNETVSVMPYAGQLPEVLGAQGRFGQDVADRVTGRGLFSPASLAPERALAQAYFRWAKQGNAQNNKLLAGVVIRRLKYLARAQEGLPEQRVPLEQALDAANQLFRESAAFRTQALILGTRGAEDIVAPRSLSLGALLGYSWVWSHTRVRGEFTLNPDLENSLRRQRLRNFRMSGAA